MADSDLKQPVNSATIFHWGSITKTLTAVAIMQLRDRGKLSLDDPVVKYVPELMRIHSPDNGVSRVTLRQLMSHRLSDAYVALSRREAMGAIRTDGVGAARGHDALSGAGI
jgi:CubicO group peptidase (beta-lactamase class C family)